MDSFLTTGVVPEARPAQRPNLLARSMMMLAGIDHALALRCPPNEWRAMALTGAGLLCGAAFTGVCVWIALGELLGAEFSLESRALATVLMTTVRFLVDRKFVAADWYAQGLAYCWSRALVPTPPLSRRLKRSVGVAGRLAYSLAFSSLIAMVLMTIVFRDASHRRLVQENLVDNAAVMTAVNQQFDRRVRELADQLVAVERTVETLESERAGLLQPLPADPAQATAIDKLAGRIDGLREARAEAERKAAAHESDRNAENAGVKPRPGNTGLEGPGRKFTFHRDEAVRLRAEVDARIAELGAADYQLAELRREAAADRHRQEEARNARLDSVDTRLRGLAPVRAELTTERADMQKGREAWVDRRVRAAPNYKPLPTDIGDRLRMLRVLAASSGLIALLMLALEVTVVAFESAGPVAKLAFTPPTHYAMWLALRLEDATDAERDRRADLAWTLRCRERRRVDGDPSGRDRPDDRSDGTPGGN